MMATGPLSWAQGNVTSWPISYPCVGTVAKHNMTNTVIEEEELKAGLHLVNERDGVSAQARNRALANRSKVYGKV
jgi:hypothetical protein